MRSARVRVRIAVLTPPAPPTRPKRSAQESECLNLVSIAKLANGQRPCAPPALLPKYTVLKPERADEPVSMRCSAEFSRHTAYPSKLSVARLPIVPNRIRRIWAVLGVVRLAIVPKTELVRRRD